MKKLWWTKKHHSMHKTSNVGGWFTTEEDHSFMNKDQRVTETEQLNTGIRPDDFFPPYCPVWVSLCLRLLFLALLSHTTQNSMFGANWDTFLITVTIWVTIPFLATRTNLAIFLWPTERLKPACLGTWAVPQRSRFFSYLCLSWTLPEALDLASAWFYALHHCHMMA